MFLARWLDSVRTRITRSSHRIFRGQSDHRRKLSTTHIVSAEVLEVRQYPAGTVTATISSSGVLNVQGSNAAETIKVTQANGRITVEGVGYVDAASVKSIVVDAKGGNDIVEINVPPQLTTKTSVNGGGGNDRLVFPSGASFAAFSGFESYAYVTNNNVSSGGSSGGSTGGSGSSNSGATASQWVAEVIGYGGRVDLVLGTFSTYREAQQCSYNWSRSHPNDLRLTREREVFTQSTSQNLPTVPSWFQDDGASVPYYELGLAVRFVTRNPYLGYTAAGLGAIYKQYLDNSYREAFRMHDWLYSRAYQNEVAASRQREIGQDGADKLLRDTIAARGGAYDQTNALIVYTAVSIGGSAHYRQP